ncbi:uncharacterized protein MELLADRAFT_111078 [Melampsora larici-populina 98AG31]|uniref:Uncharacterized protein n=1 Tax=Melampsora larici-populina (strain 98AG31 / pathotype 3-4-7) TaxID=747676 RepID=F4S1Z2_MELLP|nr:uncharacterized protein MELLADRAFT_111078 [Melampsora larici-populina 98AG31]EGG01276.1 hypothetical protein MELLADRAFT_111078 [Melampsora larici-populina 98AG31]
MVQTSNSVVSTSDAPSAIGPYSQAIKTGTGLVFISGCIPLDPSTMSVVGSNGDVAAQTEQCLKNLKAVLAASGSSVESVVKTTVFIKDMNSFGTINEVYARTFADHKPARSCVEVSRLPKDVLVEIEAIATVV